MPDPDPTPHGYPLDAGIGVPLPTPGVSLAAERLARALHSLRMLSRIVRRDGIGNGESIGDAVRDVADELPGAIDALPADALRLWCLAAGTAVEVVSGVSVLGVTVQRLCLAAAGLYTPPATTALSDADDTAGVRP